MPSRPAQMPPPPYCCTDMPLIAPSSSSFFGVNVEGLLPVMIQASFSLRTISPVFDGAMARIGSLTVLELTTSSQLPSKAERSSDSGSSVSLNQRRDVLSYSAPLFAYHCRPA